MDIVYCWEGLRDLPEDRAEAIASTMNLYPDANFLCITKLHHFFSDRFQVISWDSVMQEMKAHFKFKEIPYGWNGYMCFSDWARFWYLGNHGDTLYLDTDAKMLKRFEFGDKVVCPKREICLLYCPEGMGGNLISLLDARARQHVTLLLDFAEKMDPAWSEPISREYFHHYR